MRTEPGEASGTEESGAQHLNHYHVIYLRILGFVHSAVAIWRRHDC